MARPIYARLTGEIAEWIKMVMEEETSETQPVSGGMRSVLSRKQKTAERPERVLLRIAFGDEQMYQSN